MTKLPQTNTARTLQPEMMIVITQLVILLFAALLAAGLILKLAVNTCAAVSPTPVLIDSSTRNVIFYRPAHWFQHAQRHLPHAGA